MFHRDVDEFECSWLRDSTVDEVIREYRRLCRCHWKNQLDRWSTRRERSERERWAKIFVLCYP